MKITIKMKVRKDEEDSSTFVMRTWLYEKLILESAGFFFFHSS